MLEGFIAVRAHVANRRIKEHCNKNLSLESLCSSSNRKVGARKFDNRFNQDSERFLRRFRKLKGEEAHELGDDALNITVKSEHALL